MKAENSPARCSSTESRQAWAVHVFTTTGIVAGMLALQAVLDHRPKAAMIWLLATQIIDGVDGPMARAYDVKERVPQIDGYVLDLVIDFVTCVVIPAAFLHEFALLPGANVSLALVGLVVFTSALWFSRTDMMTPDHWFRGFPAVWNLVAPTLYLLGTSRIVGGVVVAGLAVCSLLNVPFPPSGPGGAVAQPHPAGHRRLAGGHGLAHPDHPEVELRRAAVADRRSAVFRRAGDRQAPRRRDRRGPRPDAPRQLSRGAPQGP